MSMRVVVSILRRKAYQYIERQEARGKLRHLEIFRSAFEEFVASANIDYADQLSEQKILRWYVDMRKKGNKDRTIHNKHVAIFGFLRWAMVAIEHAEYRWRGLPPEAPSNSLAVKRRITSQPLRPSNLVA